MSKKPIHSQDDMKFINKMVREDTLYTSIQNAYKAGKFNLEDKKRCCIIGNGFPLAKFNERHVFQIKEDETVVKQQWFHSAIVVYTYLTKPELLEKNDHAVKLLLPTKDTFISIAREVLNSDPDGVEFIKFLDSSTDVDIGSDNSMKVY